MAPRGQPVQHAGIRRGRARPALQARRVFHADRTVGGGYASIVVHPLIHEEPGRAAAGGHVLADP